MINSIGSKLFAFLAIRVRKKEQAAAKKKTIFLNKSFSSFCHKNRLQRQK